MNWFGHEYLFPIIIGNGKEERAAAKFIRRKTGIKPCVLAEGFDFLQRSYSICRKVSPMRDHTLLTAITDLCEGLEEYMFPVVIYGGENEAFIEANTDNIEALAVTFKVGLVKELINGVNRDDT